MAGRRRCMNSLWSGSERVRIVERLKATLAGVVELELLRCKHLEMVDAALEDRASAAANAAELPAEEGIRAPGSTASEAEHGSTTSRRQQVPSPSDIVALPCRISPEECGSHSVDGTVHSSSGRGSNSRWSTLSWDAPSDLLSPPTPDPSGTVHLDSDSRPSSGFYSVSGSSLSDSCYSVSSDAAQGASAPVARPPKLWEQVPLSADNTDPLWADRALQQQQPPALQGSQGDAEPTEGTTASVQGEIEETGLSFLSDLCSGLGDSLVSSLIQLLESTSSSSSFSPLQPNTQLDPRYCTDLVSRRTKEVYLYPSPLHAVALQSPIFTSQSQEPSASPSPEGLQLDDPQESSSVPPLPLQPAASLTQLEQYISRLARQYHSRVTCSTSDLTSAAIPGEVRGLCTPGKSHGSTQSLFAFESRSTPSSNITPCKSLLGNSARFSLSTTGKKATRNSINLGNLPSATGEDLNINLHLNLNLNLTPGLSSSSVDNPKNGSCGALRSNSASAPTASATSLSSATPTPALRARPRISTCPSSLSHRSSLEVTSGSGHSPGFGSSAFCRSLDWSSCAPPETPPSVFGSGSAPGSQRSSLIQEASSSPKISEDSPMVGEISRLSGLTRAVVVGLMEQGVELDIDCFQTDTAGEVRSHSKTHLTPTAKTDQSHDYARLSDQNPQRPIQLSLSVTHSPQSHCSLTPPLSHSSSPIHPYQSIHVPSPHYSSHCHYQQIPSPSDLPSSTASSPASRPTTRGRSPPRPLQPSPLGTTPLSVFRRDAPLPVLPASHDYEELSFGARRDPPERGITSAECGRNSTVSSYAKREDYSSAWAEEQEQEQPVAQTPRKTSNKLWRGFEGRLRGKESECEKEEMDRAEYGYGWRSNSVGSWRREGRRVKAPSSSNDKRPKVENSPMFLKKRGKEEGERRSTSIRLSRRALFRSESQDVGKGGLSKHEGIRLLRANEEDKRLSSTASLFNLSRSQSLEGSCHSLSPFSSPSFSPSPPPRMPMQRSRSLKDLGRRVFGSMRSLSLKRKPAKK
ncbi:hypothetical protein CesoFtcFv8_010079 [Champsocephalus esox]|uniref:Uncharacterized protein n=1 Tax=Champsocephalus esox TaxID=159716 RepID=A0AAN8C6S7_9TELE|nr:hypothetical protein CesoFtcFv8_010079 [Champsocephalus esox]